MSSIHSFDPSGRARAVRFQPTVSTGVAEGGRRSALSTSHSSRMPGRGGPQVQLTRPHVVSIQPASAPMSGEVQNAFNVTHSNEPTTVVYVPQSNGDMIPISLPTSSLGNPINPSMLQSGTSQTPSTQGVRMAAPASSGGPPGSGPPYGSGGGPPGSGPPNSGGPHGGAGGAWQPPSNQSGPPMYPSYT
jgi:hypothetical protein